MFTVTLAKKEDKKSIKRFYKSQNYSASFMGLDYCYLIKDNKDKNEVVASVIISQIEPQNSQYLLHALVVAKTHTKQGLATMLLNHVIKSNHNKGDKQLVCFADEQLSSLYLNNGFVLSDKNLLSDCLALRYLNYQNKHSNLKVFIAALNSDKHK